ncbi:MAG: hypothetical protein EU548_02915 [Promethearchaeota archaeon]|nr:MAG: hypothetical protein EU548_02915 [Candidatus Lokiarchaeota archaeon]
MIDVIQCWKFNQDIQNFLIPIRITNPKSKVSIIRNCLFDTGFNGYIGLDNKTIQNLDLKKISSGFAFTVKGKIEFNNYEILAEIVNSSHIKLKRIKNIDETNLNKSQDSNIIISQDFRIPILGMKSIRQFSWIILSDEKLLCLISKK